MALPLEQDTQLFSDDQRINFRASYWNTTTTAVRLGPAHSAGERNTAFGTGLGFELYDLLDSGFAPTTKAQCDAALQRSNGQTFAILGYEDDDTTPRSGVIPMIYQYWGGGAPVGATQAKRVLLHYSGYVHAAISEATLVFAGQGSVRAFVTRAGSGTVETICAGRVKEPEAKPNLTDPSWQNRFNSWGYLANTTPISLADGDKIDIYYWHNGEPWGGIACKVIAGSVATGADFLTQLRDAPILGVSFMAREQTALAASAIDYLLQAQLTRNVNTVPELKLQVGLVEPAEPIGYSLEELKGEFYLLNRATSQKIQKGRLVHFEAGYRRPNGTDELYPRFTGYIDDVFPDTDGLTATITCRGLEGRLAEVFDENHPDRVAYHVHGYILRENAAEPVFGIPAYDAWAYETVLMDLCLRAQIDPYTLGLSLWNANVGKRRFRLKSSGTIAYGARLFAARHLASTRKIALERQANYGNVSPLKKDYLPKDDPYLFTPQVTQRLFDRLRTLVEHYGYDFHFDAEGQAVLAGRNNPTAFQYCTENGPYSTTMGSLTPNVNVSAIGGTYFQRASTDGAWTRVIEGRFARADLYTGIARDGGRINVLIERNDPVLGWVTVSTSVLSTYADTDEAFYYDDRVRGDGSNACVVKLLGLPIDHYRVTLTPAGPEPDQTSCIYRLNGFAVFERDPEQSYYMDSTGAVAAFSTLANMVSIAPQSNAKDGRNHVIVVGQRKAVVSDSAKIDGENPNNPQTEFHVAVAVDPFSIYDPTSEAFVGWKRMTVVFDEKVPDGDFARWLARTILFRYRVPKVSASFEHTAIPTLDLRDALFTVEERHRTVEGLLWVTEFTERWTPTEARTSVKAEATPEIPSYQPREDIDVDRFFVDPRDSVGEPIIHLNIKYKNILGQEVTNSTLGQRATIRAFRTKADGVVRPMFSHALTDPNSVSVKPTIIPETAYLAANVSHLSNVTTDARALVNNPYRHFFDVEWNGGNANAQFRFHEGDGTAGVYDKSYYKFPNLGGRQWYFCYDHLQPRSIPNPFYDPYTSEVGNLITIAFDQLVSGRVRVSVWDANPSRTHETPIAWLTSPGSEPTEPEAHWVYQTSGKKTFVFDGTDNIGFWNVLQSAEWAEEMKGSFGDKPLAVGRGHYAWNDKSTPLHTMVGEEHPANFDGTGKPYYTIGKYGMFYVKIEVMSDRLMQEDVRRTGRVAPRTVNSNSLPMDNGMNSVGETYIWHHLAEPSQVAIRIQDWVAPRSWTVGESTGEADWGDYSTPDAEATTRAGKPVRFTFVPRQRRGILFASPEDTSVKLTRQVHLKRTVFDQFWSLSGKTWQEFHKDYNVGGSEQKRLVNRMFHNEENTLEFEDSLWRTGAELVDYEWVFDPSMFEKDFGSGYVEPLRYADYEQTEVLPGFDAKRLGGPAAGQRASLLMAYINDLFYYSAFSLDRSGRRQWCLNNWHDGTSQHGFVDKSKIVSDAWRAGAEGYMVANYESHGADRYLVRSIFCRQWKEPAWTTSGMADSPVAKYGVSGHALTFVQPPIKAFDPTNAHFAGGGRDLWLEHYSTPNSEVNRQVQIKNGMNWSGNFVSATLAATDLQLDIRPANFGSWSFDGRFGLDGYFLPSPARDFRPYWRYPLMPDAALRITNRYLPGDLGPYMSILDSTSSQIHFPLRDPARQETWYGHVFASFIGDDPAEPKVWQGGPRVEMTVEEIGGTDPKNLKWRLESHTIDRMFDYSKQDELDRFDQFRGVISRGPYPDGNKFEGTAYRDEIKNNSAYGRVTAEQPVKAAGVYLLNTARYYSYTNGPVNLKAMGRRVHLVDYITDWSDVRFRHEYVWHSERYFPCTPNGASHYAYTRDEYTRVSAWVGMPIYIATFLGTSTSRAFDPAHPTYDAGAWCGHKDDATLFFWNGDKHLRWQELYARKVAPILTTEGKDTLTGGYGEAFVPTPTDLATITSSWVHADNVPFERANFFDEWAVWDHNMRLAVGPELPESRGLVMNLTLPDRLRG